MAKKSKCTLEFEGYDDILADLERMGVDLPKETAKAVEKSGKVATQKFKEVIKEHHYTGLTEDTLVLNPMAKIEGRKIVMKTGFDINKGGLAALFLDRGTPSQKALNFVRKIKKDKEVTGSIMESLEEAYEKL